MIKLHPWSFVLLFFVLLVFMAFHPLDANDDDPIKIELEDLVLPGKHQFIVFPNAVSLIYRYRDTLIQQKIQQRGIYEYNVYLQRRHKHGGGVPQQYVFCSTARMYYLSPQQLIENEDFFKENNIYTMGFFTQKDSTSTQILTRTLTVKNKEGLAYQPVIDSLYANYPLKFRGKLFGMPYYFNWEVECNSALELIEIAKQIKAESYVESVEIQMYPCEETDLRE